MSKTDGHQGERKPRRWVKIVVGVAAVLFAISIISAIAGGGGGDDDKASNEPTRTQAAQKPADDGDTGRMDQGEFELARDAVYDVQGELQDYRTQISERCALMLGAAQVAEALDCIDEAYSGVEKKMALTWTTLDDLKGDTAKKCQRAVTVAADIVNTPLFQAASDSHTAVATLNADQIASGLAELNAQEQRWTTAYGNMFVLCAPE